MTRQAGEEAERERDEDDRYAGCFLQGLGCVGEGCLSAALPFVAVFVWLLS